MTYNGQIQGELQSQIMPALWRLGEGTVEQVRVALPPRHRSAYNTVQTVLNRLVDRGLLARERRGNAIVYRPRITEAAYMSQAIDTVLAGASAQARRVVLAQLVAGLEGAEPARLRELAEEIQQRRSQPE